MNININNVHFSYGKHLALDGVSLEIKKGKIFGLIGPNGSGKTTLIKNIIGIYKPQLGKVLFDSKHHAKETKRLIGYMPQEVALYEDLTVLENIQLFLSLYGKSLEKAHRLIDRFGLRRFQKKFVYTLSEGYKRRVSFTITLANDPPIIVMDDPTTTIDPLTRKDFWEYFRELKREDKTIILSTHILSEAEKCDEVALLHKGRVRARGSPESIIESTYSKNLEEAFTKILRGAVH